MNSTMSEEAINKRNEMFREVHPAGPATHEKTFVTVDESVYNGAFTATQGKTLADVQIENEGTVNKLFEEPQEIGRVFEPSGEKLEEKKALTSDSVKSKVNTGGVFEKQDKLDDVKVYYHDTKDTATGVKGLDPKDINNLKDQIEKDNNKKDMDPTMSGPKFLIPDMVK